MSSMNEFIKGWQAAMKKVEKEVRRYRDFNWKDDKEIFDIHAKIKELPSTHKELNKLIWMAFRAGQSCVGGTVNYLAKNNDISEFCTDKKEKMDDDDVETQA